MAEQATVTASANEGETPVAVHSKNCHSCGSSGDCRCECQRPAQSASPELQPVYVLGSIGYEFASDGVRDSIAQHMDAPANPYDPRHMLAYLDKHPWDATSITWTLNLKGTPIYAVVPMGPFAREAYEKLRNFLREQLLENVERVSIPGVIKGIAKLSTTMSVPAIQPELRGMASWTVAELLKAVIGSTPSEAKKAEHEAHVRKVHDIRNFLMRVYYELINRGVEPQERALNYAATNALTVSHIFESAFKEDLQLETIGTERSSICRPRSDCWDVNLRFFDPNRRLERAAKVYRMMVDVSPPCPVMIDEVRSWSVH